LLFVYGKLGGESEKKFIHQFSILQARRRLLREEALQAKENKD
jgi:hypothetical protein